MLFWYRLLGYIAGRRRVDLPHALAHARSLREFAHYRAYITAYEAARGWRGLPPHLDTVEVYRNQ